MRRAYEHGTIPDMYAANVALGEAFDLAMSALDAKSLSDSDKDAVLDYSLAFTGAQKMIDENSYNDDVVDFYWNVMDKFPANFLSDLAGVYAPYMFYD